MPRLVVVLLLALLYGPTSAWAGSVDLSWWNSGNHAGETSIVTDQNCRIPNTAASICGYKYIGGSDFTVNWHPWDGTGSSRAYVNDVALAGSGASFSYDSAIQGLAGCPDQGHCYLKDVSRNPVLDYGWFMTSGDGTITLNFDPNRPITELSFYWGSVDGYNTLTLVRTNGVKDVFTGNNICDTHGVCFPKPANDITDIASIVVLFKAAPGTAWDQIQFSSNPTSFEFDNLEWTYAGDPGRIGQNPVPEPGTLSMLAAAALTAAGALRRRW